MGKRPRHQLAEPCLVFFVGGVDIAFFSMIAHAEKKIWPRCAFRPLAPSAPATLRSWVPGYMVSPQLFRLPPSVWTIPAAGPVEPYRPYLRSAGRVLGGWILALRYRSNSKEAREIE